MSKELHTGLNGDGSTVWMVVIVRPDGAWDFVHRFDNEPEAKHWMKWA